MFGFAKKIFTDSRGAELEMFFNSCLNKQKGASDLGNKTCLMTMGKSYSDIMSQYKNFTNISSDIKHEIASKLVNSAIAIQATEGSRSVGLMLLSMYIESQIVTGPEAERVYEYTKNLLAKGLRICEECSKIEDSIINGGNINKTFNTSNDIAESIVRLDESKHGSVKQLQVPIFQSNSIGNKLNSVNNDLNLETSKSNSYNVGKTNKKVVGFYLAFLVSMFFISTIIHNNRNKQSAGVEKNSIYSNATQNPASVTPAGPGHKGTVVETMNSGGYTYARVDENGQNVWVAAMQTKVNVGDTVEFPDALPMVNFQSKTLKRTFDKLIFSPGLLINKSLSPEASAVVDSPTDKADAQAVAARVLSLMENGDFATVYKESSDKFKQGGSESQFVAQFQQTREKVGLLINPQAVSFGTLPGNGYVFVYRLENERYRTDLRLSFARSQNGNMQLTGLNQHDELKNEKAQPIAYQLRSPVRHKTHSLKNKLKTHPAVVYLKGGETLECQSFSRNKNGVHVVVNKSSILDFDKTEVDMSKTFR